MNYLYPSLPVSFNHIVNLLNSLSASSRFDVDIMEDKEVNTISVYEKDKKTSPFIIYMNSKNPLFEENLKTMKINHIRKLETLPKEGWISVSSSFTEALNIFREIFLHGLAIIHNCHCYDNK